MCEVPRTHTIRHPQPVGLSGTNHRSVAEAATYTTQTNTKDEHPSPQRDTNRDPRNEAAADLRLRPHGYRDMRHCNSNRHKTHRSDVTIINLEVTYVAMVLNVPIITQEIRSFRSMFLL